MAGPPVPQEFLKAENVGLRLLLEQAGIDARALLSQAGIEAKEREAADKLQKLILEELHHRIKNTLATVSAIASQSLRNVAAAEHAQHAIECRLLALGRACLPPLVLGRHRLGGNVVRPIRSRRGPDGHPVQLVKQLVRGGTVLRILGQSGRDQRLE